MHKVVVHVQVLMKVDQSCDQLVHQAKKLRYGVNAAIGGENTH